MPFRCTLVCVNADLFLVSALALVFYDTALECKQRIVSAAAYVVAGMDLRTPLANQNVPREYVLSVRTLNAEAFGFRITSVSRTTYALLMCHL